jgi:lysozyme
MVMKLGNVGRALIQSFEHLELTVYFDIRGIPTGGWGHTGWYCTRQEYLNGSSSSMEVGQKVDASRAMIWFDDDTDDAVQGVNQLCGFVPLTQNQFDALVSFTFDVGIQAFAHSTLHNKLKQGLFSECPAEFLKWDYAAHHEVEGLENRRRAEALLFSRTLPRYT